MDTREIILKGIRMRGKGLYKLASQSIEPLEVCSLEKQRDERRALLWHHRLGHLNFETLYQMLLHNAIDGLPKLTRIDYICQTCQTGKLARKKFPRSLTITTKPLEHVHTDVCGPLRKKAYT